MRSIRPIALGASVVDPDKMFEPTAGRATNGYDRRFPDSQRTDRYQVILAVETAGDLFQVRNRNGLRVCNTTHSARTSSFFDSVCRVIKLIHTADIHLDSPLKTLALRDPELREKLQCASRTAFSRIVEHAVEEQVAAVLIAGDLFDGAERSARTAAFLMMQFARLRDQGIRVLYIRGNHDAENPITNGLELPDNVHVFDGRGGKVQLGEHDVWIHGVSFSAKKAEKSLLGKFSTPVPKAINIGMLHTSLNGSAAHDVYAPCTVQELIATGFDYWALGHIHKRQIHGESPWIVMPGIPQGRDIGEPGTQSATVITVDEDSITTHELPTSSVEFLELSIALDGVDNVDTLRTLARQSLQALLPDLHSGNGVVRVRLQGSCTLRWQLLRDQEQWKETFAALARETGQLWMEKLIFDIDDAAKPAKDTSATGELAELMAGIRSEAGFIEEALAEVSDILAQLPASERAKLHSSETALHELSATLSEQGAEHLLAAMKGITP